MADDWKNKAMRYGLIGGGLGAAGSLILNAIHRMSNRPKPPEQLVPRTIVEQPYFVDEEQARQLKERGIDVRMPSFGLGKAAACRRALYAKGDCFTDIIYDHTHLKLAGEKDAGVGDWIGEGVTDVAIPLVAGLGGGYLGFRGVDWLFDKMHKDRAKKQYDERREQLRRMMDQMNMGLGKVAEDRMHGGCLDQQVIAFVKDMPQICKMAGDILRAKGMTKEAFFENLGNKVLESGKGAVKGYGGLMIGIPAILAASAALPAALRAFKQRNPNTRTMREIENYYRELPDQSRIKLVPTLRRPPMARTRSEEEDDAMPKAAAATNPSLAGKPTHNSVQPPTVDTSPDQPTDDLSMRPGVPSTNPRPATAGPSSSTAMPHPNPQISANKVPMPGMASAQMPSFSGRFSSANMGFTRRTPGNMPQPKDPKARTSSMTANIGNAVA